MHTPTASSLSDIYRHVAAFHETTSKQPLLIGVTGGVSAGKSTLSHYLKAWFSNTYPSFRTTVIPTDNFIYPNAFLIEHQLMQKKGFPESFNARVLFDFLKSIQDNRQDTYKTPLYSHDLKDIDPVHQMSIKKSDVYIIDGISLVFQFQRENGDFFLPTDLIDYCIYLDIDIAIAKERSINRFYQAFEKAKITPNPYFETMLDYSEKQIRAHGETLWNEIDVPLIKTHIEPQRHLAQLIVTDF